ncbi:MAG: DegT/DnrJ/EryC1/StrS family aminotransferase, partial [Candidatus Omnitrophota bacterium]
RFPVYRELFSSKPENLPIAEKVASQVICLPIYPDFDKKLISKITSVIKA